MSKPDHVVFANGMHTDRRNIEWKKGKKSRLYAERFEVAVLEVLEKYSGRDMKTAGIAAAMGYSTKSANSKVKINKKIKDLEERGIIRIVKGSQPKTKRYYFKQLPPTQAEPAPAPEEKPAEQPAAEPTTDSSFHFETASMDALAQVATGWTAQQAREFAWQYNSDSLRDFIKALETAHGGKG